MKTGIVFLAGVLVAAAVNATQDWAWDWVSNTESCRVFRSSDPGIGPAIKCGEFDLRITDGYSVNKVRNTVFRTSIADTASVGDKAVGVTSKMEAYGDDTWRTEFIAFDAVCAVENNRRCVGLRTNGDIEFANGWRLVAGDDGIFAVGPNGTAPVWSKIVSEGFE